MEEKRESGAALSTAEDIIREAITNDAVAQYYTAEFGYKFAVYSDGSIGVGSSIGMEIAEVERPIAQIKCPGLANLDSWFWTEGWATRDEEPGEYITEDGRRLNLSECIVDCCKNGEIDEEKEAIIESLIDSLKEKKR
jgi:hypothetical protein